MKLLVTCSNHLFRQGIAQLVQQADERLEIIEAGSFSDAIDALTQHTDLTLVLLSMDLNDVSGWTALDILKGHREDLPVVVLSAAEDYANVRRALVAGAQGYISQSSTAPILVDALRAVLRGEIYVPPSSLINAAATPAAPAKSAATETSGLSTQQGAMLCRLTPRQLDVLALIKNGKSNKEIARSLKLAEGTIKIHCMAIFRELGVTNRTQAAIRAEQLLP